MNEKELRLEIKVKGNIWFKQIGKSFAFLAIFFVLFPVFNINLRNISDFNYTVFEHFIYGCVFSSFGLLSMAVYSVELTEKRVTVVIVNGLNIRFTKTISLSELNYYLFEGHFNSGDDRVSLLKGKKRVVKVSKGAIGANDFERLKDELMKIKGPINY